MGGSGLGRGGSLLSSWSSSSRGSSAGSASPREPAVRRKPTPSLGQPQDLKLVLLPPSCWSRRLDA
ncbi:hypothetical protein Cadr_000019287 [Camelus dromedarius]|uniref:Uncharacterized protein n=1 Tax=Camelus dromedarius TaxID=9838 RepID=A0A5N4D5I1_CAMDR|nr:hypothetical protein Cadr_000019287 [Camelus dromedarius]